MNHRIELVGNTCLRDEIINGSHRDCLAFNTFITSEGVRSFRMFSEKKTVTEGSVVERRYLAMFAVRAGLFGSQKHLLTMARFSAFISDSSSEGDEYDSSPENGKRPKKAKGTSEQDDESDSHHVLSSGDESSSSSSSLSSRRRRKTKRVAVKRTGSRGGTADAEEGYAHEVVVRAPTSSPPPTDPTILPWAQQIGVDAQRMHVMQTSFFRMPEEAAALKALNLPPPPRPTVRKTIQSLARKHSRDSEGDTLRGEPREPREVCSSADIPISF